MEERPMSARKAYAKYRQATVETASPGKLVVMLYDGAIRFLGEALEHLEKRKPKETHEAIIRTENILCELMTALDMERGGKIAENLLALYEFMHLRLVEANIHKDASRINDVLALLQDLRDAWAQAVEIHAQEQFRAKQAGLPAAERTPDVRPAGSGYGPSARPKRPAATNAAEGKDAEEDEAPPPPTGGFSIVS
jgi:flagellar secretion chaperone FliS